METAMTESINNCRGCIVGSRIHREVYVRFRGEGSETCCRETVRRRILSLQPENPQLPAPDFRYPKPRDFRPYRGADAEPVKGRLQRPCGNHHRQLLLRPVFGRQGENDA